LSCRKTKWRTNSRKNLGLDVFMTTRRPHENRGHLFSPKFSHR
jgi:hypothetical protein